MGRRPCSPALVNSMSFHAYISRQPKPVVFGLYGALGGLLGAILLGEPVWAFLKPPPPPPPEPRLVMTVSPAVEVYQGNENTITVQIARDLFDSPVHVVLDDGPQGVVSEGLTIASGAAEGTLKLSADTAATVGVGSLRLSGTAVEDGKEITATEDISITVQEFSPPAIEVSLVVDCSGSMSGEKIHEVKRAALDFVKSQDLAQTKVGVVSFSDGASIESQMTNDAKKIGRALSGLIAGGGTNMTEGLKVSASQFAGKGTENYALVFTDGQPNEVFTALASGRRLRQAATILAIATGDADPRFLEELTGDPSLVIRATSGSFDKSFKQAERVIAKASERPDQDAVLSERPPPAVIKSVQSSNSFDPRRIGQLVLAIACWTGCIAALISALLSGGQLHYLKASWPSPLSVAIGLACGMVAGLVGGAVGQGLFFLTPDAPIMESVFRVLGWSLLGCLSGLGLSVFIPNLKLWHGFVGGGVGGLIGAFGYLVASQLGPGGDITGRVLGALILGFCIGLVVAFVESSFRSAWIEVWRGPREMITVSLGPEPVRIGSDSRQSTVWVPGAEGIALKYWIREGQVVCFDSSTQVEGTAIDGDQRSVGRVKIVVRTGMDERTPPVLPPGPPPPPPPRVGPSAGKPRERVVSAGVSQQVRPGGSPSREIKRGVPPPPPPPPPPRK